MFREDAKSLLERFIPFLDVFFVPSVRLPRAVVRAVPFPPGTAFMLFLVQMASAGPILFCCLLHELTSHPDPERLSQAFNANSPSRRAIPGTLVERLHGTPGSGRPGASPWWVPLVRPRVASHHIYLLHGERRTSDHPSANSSSDCQIVEFNCCSGCAAVCLEDSRFTSRLTS